MGRFAYTILKPFSDTAHLVVFPVSGQNQGPGSFATVRFGPGEVVDHLSDSYEYLAAKLVIFSILHRCVAQIGELRSHGIGYFGCSFAFGGMVRDKVIRSMKLSSEYVMPRLG